MDIHNTTEDLVITEVNAICNTLESDGNQKGLCTCNQCRQDAVCFVLNRAQPHYVVSHRGATRMSNVTDQQTKADITTLVYEGIKRVNHNQRPYFTHGKNAETEVPAEDSPVFNIPAIMGRVFNGLNFSPMTGITVELLQKGTLTVMKDNNWQNPYTLIPNTGGRFSFLPKPLPAEKADTRRIFEYTIKITAPDFAELVHVFTLPVMSEAVSQGFSMSRTFKLPDLYLFPPGEEKNQLALND